MRTRSTFLVLLLFATTPAVAAKLVVPRDHATIQEAVDAAQPGDVIRIQPGEYAGALIAKRLTIKGSPGTIISAPAPGAISGDAFLLTNVEASGSTFRGLTFDSVPFGVAGGFDSSGPIVGVDDVTIVDCVFVNTFIAVQTWHTDSWSIKNSDFQDSVIGVDGFLANNVTVKDTVILNATHAIRSWLGVGWKIKDNVIEGLPLRPPFHSVGILIPGATDAAIKNNWIRHSGEFDPGGAPEQFFTGIGLSGFNFAPLTNNVVAGNYVEIIVPQALPFPGGDLPPPFLVTANGMGIDSIGGVPPDIFVMNNRIVDNELCNSTTPVFSNAHGEAVNGPGVYAETNVFDDNELFCDDDDDGDDND